MGDNFRRHPEWKLRLRQFGRWLLVRIGRLIAKPWRASLRVEVQQASEVATALAQGPVVFAHWHSALLGTGGLRRRELYMLASPSRDGQMIGELMRFALDGYVVGSARHKGGGAIRNLVEKAQQGADLVIAVDGPIGPAYEVKDGVLKVALHAGVTIIPFHYSSTRGKRLDTWDGFWFPWPFAKVHTEFGTPLTITADNLEAQQARLQIQLRQMYERGEQWAGRDIDRSRYGYEKPARNQQQGQRR